LFSGKNFKKSAYGTISYMPAVFGAVTASVAIRDLMKKSETPKK
jgi:tRNA A37 threonylcarbamoyladenosine dehydratase